jgi:hypothetical protein
MPSKNPITKPPRVFERTWEPLARYPWETEVQWWGLVEFAMLGEDRSLDALTKAFKARTTVVPTKARSVLGQWSARNHWQVRVDLFDEERKRRELETYLDEDAEAARKRRSIASSMLTVAKVMNERLEDVMKKRMAPPREVAGYTNVALAASRVEHSGHTDVIKHEVEVGVDDDLADLLRQSIAARLPRAPGNRAKEDEPADD